MKNSLIKEAMERYINKKSLVFAGYDFRDEKGLGFWCPRCGWHKGKVFHCGLCEGREENIIEFLIKLSTLKENE